MPTTNPELTRLHDLNELPSWRRWGPYLSDRQWSTVREDYSPTGDPWAYFPFWHAHRRAYRWGEDGLAGVSDDSQYLCLALALWNGQDPILKERLFGLPNEDGNHGEDVKELYYHLDATPTHSYLKMLYKYPQARFPYEKLHEESKRRGRHDMEYELLDTGTFDENRYFDVFVEYAKAGPRDILMRVTAHNRGPDAAPLHILPTLWFRNTWAWKPDQPKPAIQHSSHGGLKLFHPEWDAYRFWAGGATSSDDAFKESVPSLTRLGYLFTENETNTPALYNTQDTGFFKDGFNECVVNGKRGAVNPEGTGTKAAAHYKFIVPAGGSVTVRCRLRHASDGPDDPFVAFDRTFAERIAETETFFAHGQSDIPDEDARRIQRQAVAGLIWTKQYYQYDAYRWLKGDAGTIAPPEQRWYARNSTGSTSRRPTSSPCRTSGSTRTSARGTPRSTRSRSPRSTRSSPRTSCCSCAASGTRTRTASSRPTSGTSPTPTRRSTRGPRGACSRSTASTGTRSAPAGTCSTGTTRRTRTTATGASWSGCSTS